MRLIRTLARFGVATAAGVLSGRASFGQCLGVWTDVSSPGPSPRQDHAMVYDTLRDRIVLFGGFTAPGAIGDTWAWDQTGWTDLNATGPSPRSDHAMAYDSARDRVVLFGGYDGALDGETWEFDGSAWTLAATGGPSARRGHAMAYDSARQRVVMFGGVGSDGGTWEWDGASWVRMPDNGSPPTHRWGHGLAFDSLRNRTVLASGRDLGGFKTDTKSWNGSAWTSHAFTTAPTSETAGLAYDSFRDRVVSFGGWTGTSSSNNTREWNGVSTSWTTTTATTGRPPARQQLAIVYDPLHRRIVLFGGQSSTNQILGDTWIYQGPSAPLIIQQPMDVAVSSGQMAAFSVQVGTVPAPSYQWRRSGANLVDDGRIVGATTASLTIHDAQPADAGSYDVVLSNACGTQTSSAAVLTVQPAAAQGDLNCDGSVNVLDINPFVLALSDPAAYAGLYPGCMIENGDINGDGSVDVLDINPFVALLLP
ncbi:Endoglucanase C precursor [Phycisphaerae bacterium RAS1]|nr:Endoglucanase C precursor [Phycisphaerae bacterium RAS1]